MPSFRPAFGKPAERPLVNIRRKRTWMGAFTLFFLAMCGCGLAIFVQRGMTFSYEGSPAAINIFFVTIGGVGRFAEFIFEGGPHAQSFQQHEWGTLVSTITNAMFYTVLLLLWLLRPTENRLKK